MISIPKPLTPGSTIAITAPSSGVSGDALARLDLVIAQLHAAGFRTIEGQCLREEYKNASAPASKRAAELMGFLLRDDIAAIIPPWGGELATEVLDHIDFARLRTVEPKWLLGYSDISTIQLPLTLLSGWATAHGPNLMDLAPTQTDPLTTSVLAILGSDGSTPVTQSSSSHYQVQWTPYKERLDAPFNLTEPTRWKRLGGGGPVSFEGRLIGGCLDTIAWLAGTRYGDIPGFVRNSGAAGTILYLENVEMSPTALVRCLLSLKRQGWFDGLAGLLIGRSAAPVPESSQSLGYEEAVSAVLSGLPCPVLYDVDIGHQPPQFTLINGAHAVVSYREGGGAVMQRFV